MGIFTERLKKYLASSTPEQLERDYIELEEYNQVGPTPERYLLSLEPIGEIRISNTIANPEKTLDFSF